MMSAPELDRLAARLRANVQAAQRERLGEGGLPTRPPSRADELAVDGRCPSRRLLPGESLNLFPPPSRQHRPRPWLQSLEDRIGSFLRVSRIESMSKPASPITSGPAPQRLATTGMPRAIASRAGTPNDSRHDIETNTARAVVDVDQFFAQVRKNDHILAHHQPESSYLREQRVRAFQSQPPPASSRAVGDGPGSGLPVRQKYSCAVQIRQRRGDRASGYRIVHGPSTLNRDPARSEGLW